MKHEKIIKREDGTKYMIVASLYLDSFDGVVWSIPHVARMDKGKRTWRYLGDTDSYEYRRLSMPDRETHLLNQYLQHVTAEEIQAAKMELWELLKPL